MAMVGLYKIKEVKMLIDIIDKKMMFSRVEKAMYFIDNEISLNENIDNKIATQVNN